MNAVKGNNSGKWVMDCIALRIWIWHISVHVEVHAIPAHYPGLTAVGELCICDVCNQSLLCAACHHQVGAVLACLWCGVTHHLYVSGQQSHFGSHLQTIAAVCLYPSEVFIVEWLVDSDGCSCDGHYCPLLSLVVIEVGRSHYNLFSHFPVNCVNNTKGGIADIDGACDHSPRFNTRCAVHRKLAFHTTDSLVPEHGLLLAIVTPIHDKSEFFLVRFVFGTSSKLSSIDCDQIGVYFHISLVRKNKFSVFYNDTV